MNHDWEGPQKIFTEISEDDQVSIRKQDVRLVFPLREIENVEMVLAVLNWFITAGAVVAEVEQARDDLEKAARMIEGR